VQSGFGGGPERWRNEREVILEAVDSDGDFLDIGCANGHLLECLCQWAQTKGIALTPFGIDYGPRLVELARQRLPQHANNFWVADAWDSQPPRRFRYVYSLYDNVPQVLLGEFVGRLAARCVEPGGTLIIGAYGSRREPAFDVGRFLRDSGYRLAGSASVGQPPVTCIAWVSLEVGRSEQTTHGPARPFGAPLASTEAE